MRISDFCRPIFETRTEDVSGWVHHSGKVLGGNGYPPHYTIIQKHWEEMGVPKDVARRGMDTFTGPSQMAAYKNGWIRWAVVSDYFYLSAPMENYRKGVKPVLRLVRKYKPADISVDMIDLKANTIRGVGRIEDGKPNNLMQWFQEKL